jgi:hypothetical protein
MTSCNESDDLIVLIKYPITGVLKNIYVIILSVSHHFSAIWLTYDSQKQNNKSALTYIKHNENDLVISSQLVAP